MMPGIVAGAAMGSAPAPTPGVWDFGAGDTASGLSLAAHGDAGTFGISSSRLILAPVKNSSNSVTAEAPGPYTSVSATFTTTARSGEVAAYPTVALGSGAASGASASGTDWWFTGLLNGYCGGIGADGKPILFRMDSDGTPVGVVVGSAVGFAGVEIELTLAIVAGVVSLEVNGVTALSFSDATYASGNAQVAQGAYSGGNGGSMSVRKIQCG